MNEAIPPGVSAEKAKEAAAPTYPVRPPVPTTTFAVNPQTTASKLLGWLGIGLFVALLFVPGVIYNGDKYWLPLFTRYMALALFAVSLDLVWGYTRPVEPRARGCSSAWAPTSSATR